MMRTYSRVHTPEERLRMREEGERRARLSALRLFAVSSMTRTLVTRILPLSGSSGWWVTAACLLPAVAVYLLGWLCLRLTRTGTLREAIRACLGPAAAGALSILTALTLLADGASGFTALICLFTEGVGSRASVMTLAVVTVAALLACLKEDGLDRGIRLMRTPLLLLCLVLLADLAGMARTDGLFPVLGPGKSAVWQAISAGWSLGWPLLLVLDIPPVTPPARRVRDMLPPLAFVLVCALAVCLALPCELVTTGRELAAALLLPPAFLRPLNRTVALCLWMLSLFLSVAVAAKRAAENLLAPWGRELFFLPGMLAAAMVGTLLAGPDRVWQASGAVSPWLLAPFALAVAIALPAAVIKRLRRKL